MLRIQPLSWMELNVHSLTLIEGGLFDPQTSMWGTECRNKHLPGFREMRLCGCFAVNTAYVFIVKIETA